MTDLMHPAKPVDDDGFCGVGGASAGFAAAGFRVIGCDRDQQPDYPFEFVRGDFTRMLPELIRQYQPVAVAGSPPCQASSALTKGTNKGREYPQLIPRTRALFRASGLPYVIENVSGAKIRHDLTLCGEMFGLDVLRHRHFELGGWTMPQPVHVKHRGRVRGWRHGEYFDGPYVAVYGEGGGKGSVAEWQKAMGIGWTDSRYSIAEAIPPAYAECIGRGLLAHIASSAVR